jgi:hypothetical protein
MMGGLHTEMAALKTLGDLLDGSGWTTILVNANVTSAGRAFWIWFGVGKT